MAKHNKNLLPVLRFPEFTGPWEVNYVNHFVQRYVKPVDVEQDSVYREIGVRSHGKGIFHKEPVRGHQLGNKRVFWVSTYAFVVNIVFGWEQAVALTSKDEDGFIASHRFPMFVSKENRTDLRFLLVFFLRKRGKHLLELASPGGAGRNKTLGQKEFEKLEVCLPKISEQQKIADLLTTVDNKLQALRRKHELLQIYKRGIMQKLFSQELRFKAEDGSEFPAWEEKLLEEIANRSTTKNTTMELSRVLTNSATQGIVDQQAYFNKEIANTDNINGYYIVRKGDYVYNPRISVSAPVGPISKNKLGDGVMSPLYTVFRFNSDDNDFFVFYFQSTSWHKYMCSVANYGARHDRMAIATSDFMNLPLPWPHPDEQEKIANFLSVIDNKIGAVGQQIYHVDTFKKGLLQKMFV